MPSQHHRRVVMLGPLLANLAQPIALVGPIAFQALDGALPEPIEPASTCRHRRPRLTLARKILWLMTMRGPEMLDRSTAATGTPKMLPELALGGSR